MVRGTISPTHIPSTCKLKQKKRNLQKKFRFFNFLSNIFLIMVIFDVQIRKNATLCHSVIV